MTAEPADIGGDPACWLHRVCPECGAMMDEAPPTRCPRCGADVAAEPETSVGWNPTDQ